MKSFFDKVLSQQDSQQHQQQSSFATRQQQDGGILLTNNTKHIIIYYSNLFKEQAAKLCSILNTNGVKTLDITTLFTSFFISPSGLAMLYRTRTGTGTIDYKNIKRLFDNHLNDYNDYKVFLFNVSLTKTTYMFSNYIEMYLTSDKQLLALLSDTNMNLLAELMDIDNIYDVAEHKQPTDAITKLIVQTKDIDNNNTVVNNIMLWCSLFNGENEFISKLSTYGQRTITGFKLNSKASPVLTDIKDWEIVALNNIRNM